MPDTPPTDRADAPPPEARLADGRLARRLRLARWVLAWERLWPLVVPPLGLAGVFVALALLDVFPSLPGWLHAGLLAAFAAGLAILIRRAVRRMAWPDEAEAARRLERDSGLAHRPLAALADRLAADSADPLAAALWQAHRRRMLAQTEALRLALPSPGMAAHDPLGLRAGVILLLVVAATIGGADAPRRLGRALHPGLALPGFAAQAEVWVTPPAYTGLAPFLLHPATRRGQPVAIPAGSTVLAALSSGWGRADLVVDGEATPFTRPAGGSQRVETRLTRGRSLAVRQMFHDVAAWRIRVEADALPSIEFSGPLEAGDDGQLRIGVQGSDDYGVARAWAEIRRVDADEPPLIVPLPLPARQPQSFRATSWHDLTASPWAGLPVSIRPMAEDTDHQVAGGAAETITLPERHFKNPVARMLVEERKAVTADRANAPQAAAVVGKIAASPQLSGGDPGTELALSLAARELAQEDFNLAEVQDLLWNAALSIEEGALASARREADAARDALDKALAANAPASEIQRLLDAYRAAMRDMLRALARRGGVTPQAGAPDQRVVDEKELEAMLDRMAGLAQSGARDALRRMLDQFSQMMANLADSPRTANPAAARALQGMRDLARRQREMLDRSFRQATRTGPDAQPKPDAASRAASRQQKELRRRLDQLADALGKATGRPAPDALSQAGSAMGEATGALGQGDWSDAAGAQGEALQQLQDGIRDAGRQAGMAGAAGAIARDPLGHPLTGTIGDDGTTRIPEHSEIQRSRRILDELRRREGDWTRPKPERDYLKRLLERF